MALTWQSMNTDASLHGFDSANRLRGQVVLYDVPAGWAAFTSGHRVDGGPWGDADAAMRATTAEGSDPLTASRWWLRR